MRNGWVMIKPKEHLCRSFYTDAFLFSGRSDLRCYWCKPRFRFLKMGKKETADFVRAERRSTVWCSVFGSCSRFSKSNSVVKSFRFHMNGCCQFFASVRLSDLEHIQDGITF